MEDLETYEDIEEHRLFAYSDSEDEFSELELDNLEDDLLFRCRQEDASVENERAPAVLNANLRRNVQMLPTPDTSRIEEVKECLEDSDSYYSDTNDTDLPLPDATSTQSETIEPIPVPAKVPGPFAILLAKRRESQSARLSNAVANQIEEVESDAPGFELDELSSDALTAPEVNSDQLTAGEQLNDDHDSEVDELNPDPMSPAGGGDKLNNDAFSSGVDDSELDELNIDPLTPDLLSPSGGGTVEFEIDELNLDPLSPTGGGFESDEGELNADALSPGIIGNEILESITPAQQPISTIPISDEQNENRKFPRITELGEDKHVYMIETKHRQIKKFIYVHGLLINEKKEIVRTGSSFFNSNATLKKLVEGRGGRILDLKELYNRKTRLYYFKHPVLLDYVDSKFFKTKFVTVDGVEFRKLVTSPNRATTYGTVEGLEVSMGHNQSFVIHVKRSTQGKHRDLSFNHPDTRTEHSMSYLEDEFKEYIFTNEDLDYLVMGTRPSLIDEGKRIYILIYTSVMNDKSSRNYYAPSFHFRKDPDKLYRIHKDQTLGTYSRYFGHFYCILHCYQTNTYIYNSMREIEYKKTRKVVIAKLYVIFSCLLIR